MSERTHTTRVTTKTEHTLVVPIRDVLKWLQRSEGVPDRGASVYMELGTSHVDIEDKVLTIMWDEEVVE